MILKKPLFFYLLFAFSSVCFSADSWHLRYDDRGLPLVDLRIENRLHTLMLDTGAGESLYLYRNNISVLEKNKKLRMTRQEPLRLIDISGHKTYVNAWKVENLTISKTLFKEIKIIDFKPWGLSIGGEQPVTEVVGLGIIFNRIILMDFSNDRIDLLDGLPIDINNWSSYAVDINSSGIKIPVTSGNKKIKLILDTAASHSILFSDSLSEKKTYQGCSVIDPNASDSDCRVAMVILPDNTVVNGIVTDGIPSGQLDFDGLLGMNFLRGHKVIVDYPGKKIYISR